MSLAGGRRSCHRGAGASGVGRRRQSNLFRAQSAAGTRSCTLVLDGEEEVVLVGGG